MAVVGFGVFNAQSLLGSGSMDRVDREITAARPVGLASLVLIAFLCSLAAQKWALIRAVAAESRGKNGDFSHCRGHSIDLEPLAKGA